MAPQAIRISKLPHGTRLIAGLTDDPLWGTISADWDAVYDRIDYVRSKSTSATASSAKSNSFPGVVAAN